MTKREADQAVANLRKAIAELAKTYKMLDARLQKSVCGSIVRQRAACGAAMRRMEMQMEALGDPEVYRQVDASKAGNLMPLIWNKNYIGKFGKLPVP